MDYSIEAALEMRLFRLFAGFSILLKFQFQTKNIRKSLQKKEKNEHLN